LLCCELVATLPRHAQAAALGRAWRLRPWLALLRAGGHAPSPRAGRSFGQGLAARSRQAKLSNMFGDEEEDEKARRKLVGGAGFKGQGCRKG